MTEFLPAEEIAQLQNIAAKWRGEHPRNEMGTTGFVTIFDGAVSGWKAQLTRPETVVPGAFAVGTNGEVSVAIGGDAFNGAEHWVFVEAL